MYTSVYWVWHAICSKGQSLIFRIQMWLLERVWLYCTWNWDSFLKCHKDVLKILSYNASDYFLKHYWLTGVSYFHMSVSAEIRTLWFITVYSVNDSFCLCNVTFGSSAVFWTNWCSRHRFFPICFADDYIVVQVCTLPWYCMY